MEGSIDVIYAGVVVGRSSSLRDPTADGLFVCVPEPLPVGTAIELQVGGDLRRGRVVKVVESTDPAKAGMRLTLVEAGAARQLVEAAQPVPEPVAPATSEAAAAEGVVRTTVSEEASTNPVGTEGSGRYRSKGKRRRR